jgi:sugar lactone lactonase YvrE
MNRYLNRRSFEKPLETDPPESNESGRPGVWIPLTSAALLICWIPLGAAAPAKAQATDSAPGHLSAPFAQAGSASDSSWETGYTLLHGFHMEEGFVKEPTRGTREFLPAFSVVPPSGGSWLRLFETASLRIFADAFPKTIRESKQSRVAMAAIVAGGERFSSQEEFLGRLKSIASRPPQDPFKVLEMRGPERLEGDRNCLHFEVTSNDRKWGIGVLSPVWMPRGGGLGHAHTRVLDCQHPQAPDYHVVLTFSETRYSDAASKGLTDEAAAFFESLVLADKAELPPVRSMPRSGDAMWIESDGTGLWVPISDRREILYIDPMTEKPSFETPVSGLSRDLAVGEGSVWTVDRDSVRRFDPEGKETTSVIRLKPDLVKITTGGGSIWVLNTADETVIGIDPGTHEVVKEISVGESQVHKEQRNVLRMYTFRGATETDFSDLLYWQGTLWVADAGRNVVHRFNPKTGDKAGKPIKVGKGPASLFAADGALWSVNHWGGNLSRIDAASGKERRTSKVCSLPVSATFALQSIWVTCSGDSSVIRVDPALMTRVGEPIPGIASPYGIDFLRDSLWVVGHRSKSLFRIVLDGLDARH